MSQSANLLGALKEGYLSKCGGSHKSWKTRWFVLTKDVLYYFDKEVSTEPLGVIQLKDYCKCKGMEGNAFQITRKDNSFFLEMPYRIFKIQANDWRQSEEWAESIANIGDFIRKREEIRNASPFQQHVITNAGDVINFGSSLIHWFKLVVDSTSSYKKGVRSIYLSAIYDIPRDLGRQIIVLARDALNSIASPRNHAVYEKLKDQAKKVTISLEKAVAFITCCAETHKGNFNSDLEQIRKAIIVLTGLTPSSPVEELTQPAVALGKACRQICQPYLEHTDAGGPSSTPTPTSSVIANIGTYQRELTAAIDSNLALIKSRPALPQDKENVQLIKSSLEKSKQASSGLVAMVQQAEKEKGAAVDINRMDSLYDDLTKSCKEIVNTGQKLFMDA